MFFLFNPIDSTNLNLKLYKIFMNHFLLPKVICNHVLEEYTESVTNSLDVFMKPWVIKNSYSIDLESLLKEYSISYERILRSEEPSGLYDVILDSNQDITILKYQKKGGSYISMLKNTSSSEMIQYIYKICSCYKNVYLSKPDTDCPTSCTKYIIAMNYINDTQSGNFKIPYYFRMKLDDMNSMFGQTQLEHLRFQDKL
jgi:hypothetical protein